MIALRRPRASNVLYVDYLYRKHQKLPSFHSITNHRRLHVNACLAAPLDQYWININLLMSLLIRISFVSV